MKRGIKLVRGHLFVACMTLLSAMFFAFTNAYGATYSYTDIPGSPIAIDGATTCTAPITRNIVVSDSFTISDLDVGFIASHVWRADVEVTLTAPDATSVQIIAGVGGDIDNYNVLMDSASASSLADGINHNTAAAPYEYTRAPSNSLGAFNGKSANGTWVLEVCDNWPSADDGTYIRSELIFTDTGGGGGSFAGTSTTPASGTVLNSYHKVTSLSGTSVTVDTSAGISAGDRGVLIQMKGATIDTSDTASHGDVSSYASAGRFEYVDVASVSGSTLILESAPTVSFSPSGYVQFVRVPIYDSTTLTGTISALPWDGDKGGVVAIDDIGTLTLSGDINVTGLGFAGGALATTTPYDSCASDQNNYTGAVQAGTGNKGEGITAPNTSHAARRGHKANGGGGGNITDAGGGGGANYGFGGLGGRELDLCDNTGHYGGLGGQPLDYSTNNRLFFGGGGGSGSEISQAATGGDRSGGGLILLRAKAIDGTGGRLISNGLSALQDNDNGADGGGAAGAIAVSVHDSVTGLPIAQGDGGDGGNEANTSYAHGTGGGGGGGALLLNGPVCADFNYLFDGGEAGVSTLGSAVSDPNWGALDGGPGACMSSFTELPLVPLPGADDYSDAPASFGDATHTVTAGIQLGAAIDADSGSLASADATGDDADATDDEDGVSAFPTLTVGDSSYTLPAANVSATGTGTLHAWIDFDGSGVFESGEHASVTVTSGALSGDLSWSSLPALSAGTTFARFRLTSDGSVTNATPSSAATDGEVEDYQLPIAAGPTTVNCGTDTDSGYATGGTGNYTNDIFWLDWTCGVTTQFLAGNTYIKSWDIGNGVTVTATISNLTADIEPYNTGSYFEDALDDLYSGVNPIGLINVTDSQDPSYDMTFSATLNGTPIPANVVMADAESSDSANENWTITTDGSAWQPIEATGALDAQFLSGAQTLYMSDDASAGGGTLLSLTEGVSTINVAMNAGGKQAGAYGVIFNFDFGDANGIASGGHLVPVSASGGSQPSSLTAVTSLTMATLSYGTDLYLGTVSPDTESSDQGSVNADGDDTDGTDDEDGISAFPTLTTGDTSYTISTTNIGAVGTGTLHAWIDFDGDNVFETGEYTSATVTSGTLSGDLVWSSLPFMTAGNVFARFRITSDGSMNSGTPNVAVINGEIEDYLVTISAAPVGPLACPVGQSPVSGAGNADAVIVAALNSTFALGVPEAPGTTATNSNAARLTTTNPTLTLDMTDLVPENATIALTIAKNNAAADYTISLSDDNVTYTPVATYNTGTEDQLQPYNVTVPTGGARYVQFQRNSGSLWVGGLEYSDICVTSASLTGSKTVEVWDPTTAGLYAVPGNDVIYSISGTNTGVGATDTDTIVLIDPIPSDVEFYNGDIDDGGPETDPVSFTQTAGAGLTFNYTTDVAYSDAGTAPADFASCTYTPAAGYDPAVSYICVNPKGALAGGDPDPSFTISFRARIK